MYNSCTDTQSDEAVMKTEASANHQHTSAKQVIAKIL